MPHRSPSRRATPTAVFRVVLVLAATFGVLAAISCSDETPAPPAQAVVAALLSGNQLTILYVGEDNAAPLSREGDGYHPALSWEFQATGGGITRGTVIDPRYVVSEFEVTGQANPVVTKNDSGMFIIEVPNTGGTLTVNEAAPGTLSIPQLHPLGTGSSGTSSSASVPPIASGSKAQATSSGLSTSSGSSGPSPVKIVDNGTCAAVNILLTSDGYTSSQQAKFNSDAMNAVNILSTKAGYSDHWKDINVWTLFVPSNASGISDPGCTPGKGECPYSSAQAKSLKDTAFSNSFGDNAGNGPRRLVANHSYGQTQHKENYATLASAQQKVQAALPGILCNTSEYGGSGDFGGTLVFTADPSAGGSPFLLAHEAGHALFILHDEYTYGTCGQFGFNDANTSQSATNPPWKSMINTKQLPTTGSDSKTIGAYEGADYCPTGAYRPQYDCMMRTAGADEQMCAVCRHRMDDVFTQHAGGACGKGGVIGTGKNGGKGKGSPPKKNKCMCGDSSGGDGSGESDGASEGGEAGEGGEGGETGSGSTGGDALMAPPVPDSGTPGDEGGQSEAGDDGGDGEAGDGQSEAGDDGGNEAGDDEDDDACSCDANDSGDEAGDGGDGGNEAGDDGGGGEGGGEGGGTTCDNSSHSAPTP
jgi:hypothetical protein